jgi:hypothetical protein
MLHRTTIIEWLFALVLTAGGCQKFDPSEGQGAGQGDGAIGPGPSVVSPGGCQNLCACQATCLKTFRSLGGEPLFVTPPGTPCDKACEATARDRLVGKVLDGVIRECTSRKDCDGFYGCAIRIWLTHMAAFPWKRGVLRAQHLSRTVAGAVRRSQSKRAMRLCDVTDLFRTLGRRTEPAAVQAFGNLASACAGAVKMRLESVVQRLEALVPKLEPDTHSADCKDLRAWKPPYWLPPQHPARKRIFRATTLCTTLDAQRKLAFAVKYAHRDAGLVRKLLKSGESGDAAYYKCVHKGKTLSILQKAGQPMAKVAATALREVCFEQFPVAFLSRHRKMGTSEPRHCYKIRQVTAMLSVHASRTVIAARTELLRWAAQRCPAP